MTQVASKGSIFDRDLDPVRANHVPLTPTAFLHRTAQVFPNRVAVRYGALERSYAALHERAVRLSSALTKRGIARGDTVAILAPNTPEMLEAHYGVAMAQAVLNPINIRLDAATIAFVLRHGEAKVLLTDTEFAPVVEQALALLAPHAILVVDIDDPLGPGGKRLGSLDYEALLMEGDPDFAWDGPADEWQALALSYTSGTTGDPKGVVYHHRGAYLNTLANVAVWAMPKHPVYLWTLPIFHSLGWCFPWTVTLMAGTHVCLRKVEGGAIFDLVRRHGVTHMCGAPIVLSLLIAAGNAGEAPLAAPVKVMTAASPPPAAVIRNIERLGFDICHVYGLTEVFGPAVVCEPQDDWSNRDADTVARLKARQGVAYPTVDALDVLDVASARPVPWDGQSLGEVVVRSNTVMRGYLKNPAGTATALVDGWFHTGDLGVRHPDGYIELKDRSKDVIISGGENISSIEVEDVLYTHPAVLFAAVVARPDETWGEVPLAFVELKPGAAPPSEADLIAFCRDRLAGFKRPKGVVFGPLPKTSTGKIQKFLLRQRAQSAS